MNKSEDIFSREFLKAEIKEGFVFVCLFCAREADHRYAEQIYY